MDEEKGMTFWEHLEALRGVILKVLALTVLTAVAVFCFKEPLFKVILAPSTPDFITYGLFEMALEGLGFDASAVKSFHVELVSTTLTAQFMTHMKLSLYSAAIVALPYILVQLYGFIQPALRQAERRYMAGVTTWSYLLFMAGVLLDYFLIFPLAFRFLGTYQVSAQVPNMITIVSYSDMLLVLSLMMGILFELPIVSWFLAKTGLTTMKLMKHYRRHAVVVILIISALITPTTDIFTLLMVSLPICLLYEVSILIAGRVERHSANAASSL